jgi:hypothetical protein
VQTPSNSPPFVLCLKIVYPYRRGLVAALSARACQPARLSSARGVPSLAPGRALQRRREARAACRGQGGEKRVVAPMARRRAGSAVAARAEIVPPLARRRPPHPARRPDRCPRRASA